MKRIFVNMEITDVNTTGRIQLAILQTLSSIWCSSGGSGVQGTSLSAPPSDTLTYLAAGNLVLHTTFFLLFVNE